MNKDIIEGNWKKMTGSVKENWGKLTDDDIQQVEGKLEKFQGLMQEKYGMGKDEAKKEFDKLKK
ncbi:MAG: CsbD family protein [Aliiglaciecola sp.]|uniref:CsbD family protein n=1 Tax=Aliiglaciecola sp. M165 TaxID=2593649 RepID=UPI00118107C3|nr:CsbD family protein [Aliiglaciecola sp. M165]TRY32933.1 CsbD family protein [Aliiglaciecola sp. M165]